MGERERFDPTSQVLFELANKYGMKNIPAEELAKLGYGRDEQGDITKLAEVKEIKEQPPLTELPKQIKLNTLEYADFNGDYKELVRKYKVNWRRNHKKLLSVVKSGHVPFFGLHGTNLTALEQIENETMTGGNIVTFYKKPDKEESENFLYKLYQAALVASNYMRSQDDHHALEKYGGVIVLNLEEDGENITGYSGYENLTMRQHPISFSFDSESEQEFYRLLNQGKDDNSEDHSLSRSGWGTADKDKFAQRFRGTIRAKDLKKYSTPLAVQDPSSITRNEIRRRFLAQEILARSFELLAQDSNHETA